MVHPYLCILKTPDTMVEDNASRILVVDDEEDICEILKFNLESEGFSVDTVNSAEEALLLKLDRYQLFLLDIMMKGMSGYKLADEIRKRKKITTPLIFITAKNAENDKLTGFSLGADDFITKPFSVKEIVARVKAVIRRSESLNDDEVAEPAIKISGIELDTEKKRLTIDGKREDLTPIEFQLLYMLLKNQDRIFNRDQILSFVWKEVNVTERTVDVHVTRLRKKLGTYGKYLVTRKGYGYCFEMD
jgi:two-component system, OmpR family, alkaline phosphatase synthesis response regulator PhoP